MTGKRFTGSTDILSMRPTSWAAGRLMSTHSDTDSESRAAENRFTHGGNCCSSVNIKRFELHNILEQKHIECFHCSYMINGMWKTDLVFNIPNLYSIKITFYSTQLPHWFEHEIRTIFTYKFKEKSNKFRSFLSTTWSALNITFPQGFPNWGLWRSWNTFQTCISNRLFRKESRNYEWFNAILWILRIHVINKNVIVFRLF